jgi:hypothetical protein
LRFKDVEGKVKYNEYGAAIAALIKSIGGDNLSFDGCL